MDDGVHGIESAIFTGSTSGRSLVGGNASGVVDGSRPEVRVTAATTGALITSSANGLFLGFLDLNANSNILNVLNMNKFMGWGLRLRGSTGTGVTGGTADSHLAFSEVHNCGTTTSHFGVTSSAVLSYCRVHNNSGVGVRLSGHRAIGCVFDRNATRGCDITGNTTIGMLIGCVADSNGGTGFRGRSQDVYINCVSTRNGSYGWDTSVAGSDTGVLVNCLSGSGAWANTSGNINAMPNQYLFPSLLTGDPQYADPDGTPPDYRMGADGPLSNGIPIPRLDLMMQGLLVQSGGTPSVHSYGV
jgi:hypothetical protein